MENTNNIEKIEAYLNGELNQEERTFFEAQLKTDTTLASEMELYQRVDQVLADDSALAFQKLTEQAGANFFTQKTTNATIRKLPFYRRPLAIAASITLLVACGFLWWMTNSTGTLSNDELFAANYESYAFSNTVRGNDDPVTPYEQAVLAYQNKDWTKATSLFSNVLEEEPSNASAAFGLGNAYLAIQPADLDAAALHFQQVIDDGKSLLVDKAKWYLALIRIKQGDITTAKQLLEQLLQSEEKQLANKAQTLIDKL